MLALFIRGVLPFGQNGNKTQHALYGLAHDLVGDALRQGIDGLKRFDAGAVFGLADGVGVHHLRIALVIFDPAADNDIGADGELLFQPVFMCMKEDEVDRAGGIGAPDFIGQAFARRGDMFLHPQGQRHHLAVRDFLHRA